MFPVCSDVVATPKRIGRTVRIAAVVDSRNMRGLAASLLGVTRNPTVKGLEETLDLFGFELERAFFSVALPRERDRRRLNREFTQNERYMSKLTRDVRVAILEGELQMRSDGTVEEKIVDVLCAVETIRQAKRIADSTVSTSSDGVLLLSQDADLGPGIGLAQEFGVPVYSVAPGKVHQRGYPFLVLDESAMAALCGVDHPHGQQLRRSVAESAKAPMVDSWEFRYVKAWRGAERAWMYHRHGLQGVCNPAILRSPRKGDLFDLAPIGVLPAQGNEFPVLELAETPSDGAQLVSGVVVGRFGLFRITVQINGERQVKVYASNSYLTPDTPVLLQKLHTDGERYRYVGALGDPPPLIGSGGVERGAVSVLVEVRRQGKGHAYGTSVDAGIEVFIPCGASATVIGGRYLVSLAGAGRDPDSAFVAHLASTQLPGS